MEKIIRTPEYWKKPAFQPMVEVRTAYENKVRIPQRFQLWWETRLNLPELARKHLEQAVVDGAFDNPSQEAEDAKQRWVWDMTRVLFEMYRINENQEQKI